MTKLTLLRLVLAAQDTSRPGRAVGDTGQFAGFGVAPDRGSLRPLPTKLQVDDLSAGSPQVLPEASSNAASPIGHKQVHFSALCPQPFAAIQSCTFSL